MTGIYHGRRIMRRLLLERALNMKKNSNRLERGFLALAALLLGLAASVQAANVTYSVGTDQDKSADSLDEAAKKVNAYVVTDQTGNNSAVVTVHKSPSSTPGGTPYGAWVFDGSTVDNNGKKDYVANKIYGFDNLAISGGSSSSKTTLDAHGQNTMLLKLLNADGDISAANLVLSGGKFAYEDIRNGNQNVMGKTAGGAGLTIGSNGVYPGNGSAVGAADNIDVDNLSATGNSITLTNATYADSAYGAGILVNAYGIDNTGNVVQTTNTVTGFDNVNLTENKIAFTKGGDYGVNDVNVAGGGAAINLGQSFTYNKGSVTDNSVALNNGAYVGYVQVSGGGLASGAKVNTLDNITFKNNTVLLSSSNNAATTDNFGYNGMAGGGAAHFDYEDNSTTNTLNDITATGNTVTTSGSGTTLAAGGAFVFGAGTNSITNSTLSGNQAVSNRNAFGGAIFLTEGDLTLHNTSVTGNSVSGGNRAEGSAIFIGTEGDEANLTILADAGKTVSVEGNSTGGNFSKSGIYFGRHSDDFANTLSTTNATLNVGGAGTVKLLNGLNVEILNDTTTGQETHYGFTFQKDPATSGALYLDGEYRFSTPNATSSMDIKSGKLYLGNNFTAYNVKNSNTALNVDLRGVESVSFDLSRDPGNAPFQFDPNADGNMQADTNTKVYATGYARSVASFYDRVYNLVTGLDDYSNLAPNLDFIDSRYYTGDIDYNNSALFAKVDYTSPFEFAGPNARMAQYPLQNLISQYSNPNDPRYISDAEIGYWLDSPLSVVPNLYIEQADIMFNGADRVAHTAVYTGLKQAHRAKLYNENYQAGRDRYRRRVSSYSGSMYPRGTDYVYPSGSSAPLAPTAGMPATGLSSGYSNGFQTGGMGAQAGVQAGGMGLQGGYSAGVQGGGVGVQGGVGLPGGMVGGGVSAGGGDYNYNSGSAFPSARLMDCASLYDGYGFRLWAGYLGDFRSKSSDDGYIGYKTTRHGFLVGLNYDWGAMASVGFYAGYSHTRTNSRATDEHTRGDNAHLGLMGRLSPFEGAREFSLYADIGYHYARNRYNRGVGYGYEAHSSFNQDLFGFGVGVEHIFRVGGVNLIPHFELRYGDLSQGGLSEAGSSSTLSVVDGPSTDAFNSRLGVEVGKDFYTYGTAFTPTVGVAWRHDYGDRSYETFGHYSYNAPGGSFRLASGNTSRDSADISAALKTLTDMGGGTTLGFNLSYNINLAGKTTTQTVYAGVEVGF